MGKELASNESFKDKSIKDKTSQAGSASLHNRSVVTRLYGMFVLASFGTLSISFFIANLCRSFHLTLNLNLYLASSLLSDKVLRLHSALKLHISNTSPHIEPSHVPTNFTVFSPATREEICKLI